MSMSLVGLNKQTIALSVANSQNVIKELKERKHDYVFCVERSCDLVTSKFHIFLNAEGIKLLNTSSFAFELTSEFIEDQAKIHGQKVNPLIEAIIHRIDIMLKDLKDREHSVDIARLQAEGHRISNIQSGEEAGKKFISVTISPRDVTEKELQTFKVYDDQHHWTAIHSTADRSQNSIAYAAGRYMLHWIDRVSIK